MAVELRRLEGRAGDYEVVRELLAAAPTYESRTLGRATTAQDAVRLLCDRPPGCGEDAKSVFLVVAESRTVGLVDLIRGWPSANTTHVGLLLLREDQQRRGFGRAAVDAVEVLVSGWPEISLLRASVVESNVDVLGFWEAVGFAETGERRQALLGDQKQAARVLVKSCWVGRS